MKEILIKKYMNGTSSRQDEQTLLRLLQEEPLPTAEDRALLSMLEMSASEVQGQDTWLEEDESELFDQLMKEQHGEVLQTEALPQRSRPSYKLPPRHLPRIIIRSMAAAAILCGVFFAARIIWKDSQQDVTVTYLYGNKVEDSEMAMDMMHETLGDIFDRPDVESELTNLFN